MGSILNGVPVPCRVRLPVGPALVVLACQDNVSMRIKILYITKFGQQDHTRCMYISYTGAWQERPPRQERPPTTHVCV